MGNDKFMARGMQTFNGVSKTKKTQTERVNMVDAGRVDMRPLPLGQLDLERSVDSFKGNSSHRLAMSAMADLGYTQT